MRFWLIAFLLICSPAFAISKGEVALVLMHGKDSLPPGPMAQYFERDGFRVISPAMPWSRGRNFDVPYNKALDQLHQQILKLRADGAKLVIVGGQSLGANGALAYQAKYGDADALMLFSPGHMPSSWYRSGATKKEVDQAAELYKQGKGAERYSFTDYNQDSSERKTSTVESYLSYFKPQGSGNMAISVSAIRNYIPVLVVNSQAEVKTQGRDYIFSKLPPNPKSVYVEVSVGHTGSPEAAVSQARDFVSSVMKTD